MSSCDVMCQVPRNEIRCTIFRILSLKKTWLLFHIIHLKVNVKDGNIVLKCDYI